MQQADAASPANRRAGGKTSTHPACSQGADQRKSCPSYGLYYILITLLMHSLWRSVKLVCAFLSVEEMVDLMWHWAVDLELFPPSVIGLMLGGGV
ncbi:hypothetical protein AOLI_G00088590 [Acnodon oligacanthus]